METREVVDVFNEDDAPEVEPQEQPQQQTQPVEKTPAVEPKVETPAKSDDVRQAVAEAFKEFGPKQPAAPAQPEMSEADKRKLWAIFNPEDVDPKFFNKFFGLGDDADELTVAERKTLFAKMHEGMMRQAVTAAHHMLNARFAELDQRLNPLQEHFAQARAGEVKKRFHDTYPALSDKRFEKLLKLSATALKDQPFDSEEQYFKALADHAADAIEATTGSKFDVGAPPVTKPTPGTAPKTPRSRVGGTGGAGSGSSQAPATTSRDDASSIF